MPDALGPARRALVALAASLGTRRPDVIRAAMKAAAAVSGEVAVEEVILQSHLFVGFPDALNALGLWREVSGRAPSVSLGEEPAAWEARGERVCAAVYAGNYARLRENVRALHPDVDGWMVTGGYGRVIGRPGVDLATRELCIAALLAVWNVPRQLHSHLRGALNTGASVTEVDEAVEVACGFVDDAQAADLRALWGEVAGRLLRRGGD